MKNIFLKNSQGHEDMYPYSDIKMLRKILRDIKCHFEFDNDCKFGEGVRIDNYVNIGRNVIIGNDARIGPYTSIGDDCVIGENVKTKMYLHIANNVTIGNNVKINDNIVIGNRVKIGNNTDIDTCTNIFHDTYIGAHVDIGKFVNISQHTTIEDNVIIDNSVRIINNTIIKSRSLISRLFHFRGSNHVVDCYSNDMIRVGCEMHSTNHWIKNFKAIGKNNGYTDKEITEYKKYIVHSAKMQKIYHQAEAFKNYNLTE